MSPHCRIRNLALILFGLSLVFVAGCSSEPEPTPHSSRKRPPDKPPTPMAGHETFFDGLIVAELKTGGEGIPHADAAEGGGGKSSGNGGGHSWSGGGGGGHGHHGGNQPADSTSGGGGDRENPRPMMASMGPTVMIHLRFTNTGTTRVELRIEDFVSPLGDFAVQPEMLALDPGQSLETEPMSSRLAGELVEIAATLELRLGGKAEKKSIILHAVPAAPQLPNPPSS